MTPYEIVEALHKPDSTLVAADYVEEMLELPHMANRWRIAASRGEDLHGWRAKLIGTTRFLIIYNDPGDFMFDAMEEWNRRGCDVFVKLWRDHTGGNFKSGQWYRYNEETQRYEPAPERRHKSRLSYRR